MTEWVEATMSGLAEQSSQILKEAGDTALKACYPTSITQRVHGVDEVANPVLYVCSTQTSATIRSALRAEGGIVESIV